MKSNGRGRTGQIVHLPAADLQSLCRTGSFRSISAAVSSKYSHRNSFCMRMPSKKFQAKKESAFGVPAFRTMYRLPTSELANNHIVPLWNWWRWRSSLVGHVMQIVRLIGLSLFHTVRCRKTPVPALHPQPGVTVIRSSAGVLCSA